mmetsp:Transcript_2926/g.7033  ORF Transcript_2926/g.7033 Transcript_2926/m.7033 type:complete len:226 (+) Transcript_2926:384-1061(+)
MLRPRRHVMPTTLPWNHFSVPSCLYLPRTLAPFLGGGGGNLKASRISAPSVDSRGKSSKSTASSSTSSSSSTKGDAQSKAPGTKTDRSSSRFTRSLPSPSSKTTSYTSQFTSFGSEGVAQPGYHSRASSSLQASSCQPQSTREFSASLRRVIVVVRDASATASFARRAARNAGSAWSSINSSRAASSSLFTVPYFCACARVSCTRPSNCLASLSFSSTKQLSSAA